MSLPEETPLPPNPLNLEDTKDGNLFELFGGRCVSLDYLMTPVTPAVKHCPAFPLYTSNYAHGMWVTQKDVRKKQASDGIGAGGSLVNIDEHYQELLKSQKLLATEIFSANPDLKERKNSYSRLVDNEENTSQDPIIEVDKVTRQIKIFNPILGKTITFYPANIPVRCLSQEEIEKITKPVTNAVVADEEFRSRYAKLNAKYGGNQRIDHQPCAKPASIDMKLPEVVVEQKQVKPAQVELKQKPTPSYRPKPKRPRKAKPAPQITPAPVTPPIPKPDEMTQNLAEIKLPSLDPTPCPKPFEMETPATPGLALDVEDDQDVLEIFADAMDDLF